MTKDGGPAFPGFGQVFTTDAQGRTMPQSAWGIEGAEGMSLRARIALEVAGHTAMAKDFTDDVGIVHLWPPAKVARRAVEVADALIAELEKAR